MWDKSLSIHKLFAGNLLFLCPPALYSSEGNEPRPAGAGSWFRCVTRTELCPVSQDGTGSDPPLKLFAGHPQPW